MLHTNSFKRRQLGSLAWGALLVSASVFYLSPKLAQAQTSPGSYPTKPIRLVVPFPAGGATDIFARTLSQKLGEKIGATVVVENKPGAGGTLGSDSGGQVCGRWLHLVAWPHPARTPLART
jgi:tripartite-type tricarboxylate transporter receptor subunit TctC